MTLDEARRMAQEALELRVGGMVEDGEELPAPSSLDAIMADLENGDAVAFLVTLPEAADRTVRVDITLPNAPPYRRARQEPLRVPGPRRREGSRGELTDVIRKHSALQDSPFDRWR